MINFFKFIFTTLIIHFHRKTNQAVDFEMRGNQKKKILIIAYDALGDFIIASPLFQQLKVRFNYAELHLLASERNTDLAKQYGWFQKIWSVQLNTIFFDQNHWKKIREIQESRYDLVINLFDEPDDVAISKILFIAKSSQFLSLDLRPKSFFQKLQLLQFKKFFSNRKFFAYPAQSGLHFLERMYKICEFWSNAVAVDFKYIFPEIKSLPATEKIYFHPFGSQKNNCLSLEAVKSITATIGENNYILPALKNRFTGEALRAHYPQSENFKNFFELAEKMKSCKAVISVDTATAHLAIALGKPLFLIRANEAWREGFDPHVGKFLIFKSDNNKIESLDLRRLQSELRKFISQI